MRFLLTGGCGFIGTNLVHHLLKKDRSNEVIIVDALTYAGHRSNHDALTQEMQARIHFYRADVADLKAIQGVFCENPEIDCLIHLAAESHVDRSIRNGIPFARTNILGTQVMLQSASEAGVKRFVLISTDEVYGDRHEQGPATESTILAPSSPYAASKAAADHLALAAYRTYKTMDICIVRPSNTYGGYQYPEKLIPLMIFKGLKEGALPVYGDGLQVREWTHVNDVCRGIHDIAREGKPGEIYNLGSGQRQTNLLLVKRLCDLLNISHDTIQHVSDRKGHDRRYTMDSTKLMNAFSWQPQFDLERGLEETVKWYLEHRAWGESMLQSAAYRDFIATHYSTD
jgi:dTDP-glucose 4,6-dehydratase